MKNETFIPILLALIIIMGMALMIWAAYYLSNQKDFMPPIDIKRCYINCDKAYQFKFLQLVKGCNETFNNELDPHKCMINNMTTLRNYCLGNCFVNSSFMNIQVDNNKLKQVIESGFGQD